MNTVLSVQVSLLAVLNLPIILSPTTCCRSRSLVWLLSETYRAARSYRPPTSRRDYSVLGFAIF